MGFPKDEAKLRDLGVYPVKNHFKVYDELNYKPIKSIYTKDEVNGVYIRDYELVELTKEEKEQVLKRKVEERFEQLRSIRKDLLSEYDVKISQLNRELRLASTDEEKSQINTKITLWDSYAKELCDITELEGAPWFGSDIPWPSKPE